MKVIYRPDTVTYRGEEYPCVVTLFQDEDGGEPFTTTESDTVWFNQVTNQYRAKYGIPYTDEIIALREKYGLSATKMSAILGFGVNLDSRRIVVTHLNTPFRPHDTVN